MFQELTNSKPFGLYSMLDVANFWPFVLSERAMNYTPNDTKVKSADIFLGYLIVFWTVLYFIYGKCLNSLFRRMHIPLLQRNRIIEAAWNCGFSFGSICYVTSSTVKNIALSSHGWEITHQELALVLHKSFYFHRAGIAILYHGIWTKALTNLLFASFVLNVYQQKWCVTINFLLFHKAFDTVTIDFCRILLCFTRIAGKARRITAKIVLSIHGLNWIYLYVLFVPKLILWPEKDNYMQIHFSLWLWFVAECMDSVWLRLCGCIKANYWLEICLFPPPTEETIKLTNIQKRHKNSLKKTVATKIPKKAEIWKTLLCAMLIKKKIRNRRKQTNQGLTELLPNSERIDSSEIQAD